MRSEAFARALHEASLDAEEQGRRQYVAKTPTGAFASGPAERRPEGFTLLAVIERDGQVITIQGE